MSHNHITKIKHFRHIVYTYPVVTGSELQIDLRSVFLLIKITLNIVEKPYLFDHKH